MRDTIIALQNYKIWKILLTIAANFISSKDVEEEGVMHSKSDNIEFMPQGNVNEVVDEFIFDQSIGACPPAHKHQLT